MDDLTGKVIKSYTLLSRIGQGGFGAVYRAEQSIVNREVAIKVILPAYANHPEFIRSFEFEAQVIARLEHPHIVPLYDFWREPDSAYLVMRWLRGGNLRASLIARHWELEEVVWLVEQIATALMTAHRQGIVHLDIKPDNILLDDDNNAYLSDFGIAKDLIGQRDALQDVMVGSPEYMAPEQVLRTPLTPYADIYSLGIVLYQILTGQQPFRDQSVTALLHRHVNDPVPPLQSLRPDLPPALNSVIWRATAKNPYARYPDVLALAKEFRQAAGLVTRSFALAPNTAASGTEIPTHPASPIGTVQLEPPTGSYTNPQTRLLEESAEPVNPYKGLRPFEEADAADFFGRAKSLEALIARLKAKAGADEAASERFLALVGPSGSGKSSLVKAGLIPALRRRYVPGSAYWFISAMTPGPNPFEELRTALLAVAAGDSAEALDKLDQSDDALAAAVAEILPGADSTLLLFIDQFEEIFTLGDDEDRKRRFLANLMNAVARAEGRLWVMITLRADFYDRPLLYAGFGDLMRRNTEVVLPLSASELEQAMVGPADRAGLLIEPELIAAVIADVSAQAGALPLLQYTLTELFEARDGLLLSLKAYQERGGVVGSLARRAEEIYADLSPVEQEAARQLFLRLVTLGEGSEATRRRVLWQELISLGDSPEAQARVLGRFSKYRLLTLDRDPATRQPVVLLAHEALIHKWGRFQEWIESSRDDLRVQRRLAVAAADWLNAAQDASFLASGARLAQFEELYRQGRIALTENEIRYLRGSLAQRDRARLRARLFIAGLIGFSVLALALALFAFDQQRRAITERDRADLQSRVARSRELAVTALVNSKQPDLGLLLSLEALAAADTFEARNSLLTTLQSNPAVQRFLHGQPDPVRAVAFSPDGMLLAAGGRGQIMLWDVQRAEPLGQPILPDGGAVNSVVFSADSRVLIAGGSSGTIQRWAVTTGAPEGEPLQAHTDAVWSLAVSHDGRLLASGSADSAIILWDMATGQPVGAPLAGHEDIVYSLAFSPDDRLLVSGSADGTVRLWDVDGQQPHDQPLAGHRNWVLAVAFSPDGRVIASADADSRILLHDVSSGALLREIDSGHTDWIRSLAFSPDGRLLVTGSADHTLRLWDVASGSLAQAPLAAHSDAVWSVAFSPDGKTIASGSADRDVILWNTTGGPALNIGRLQAAQPLLTAAFSPDGEWLGAAGGDPTSAQTSYGIELWNLSTGSQQIVEQHSGPVTGIAFSPDGRLLASASADKTVAFWDLRAGQPRGEPLVEHNNVVWSVAFSPDGTLLASGGDDGAVIFWDVDSQTPSGAPLRAQESGVLRVAFSPDGTLLAAAGRDNTITLWDVETRARLGEPLIGHDDIVTALAFSPDGRTLVSGSRDAALILWAVRSRQLSGEPLRAHTDYVLDVAFSPDGRLLASGSADGSFILWDVETRRPLGEPFPAHTDWLNSLAFNRDGSRLLTASFDQRVMLWDTRLASWVETACRIAHRDLTASEWATFFPSIAYHRTCAG